MGIDPRIDPSAHSREALGDYGRRVVDACAPYAAAFKPQLAFFERHGASGWDALDDLLAHIRDIDPHFPVILDAKRGDIGSTAEAYAQALLDRPGALAVTLSPYLGFESVKPFLRRPDAGVFVLCRTSNDGAGRLQEHRLDNGTPLYLAVADEALSWEQQSPQTQTGALGPSGAPPRQIGLVAAGNTPGALAALRRRHPQAWFLAPGIGAQGGRPQEALSAGARHDGFGLLASASRSVADAPHPGRAARSLKEAMDLARETLLSKTPPQTAAAAAPPAPQTPAPQDHASLTAAAAAPCAPEAPVLQDHASRTAGTTGTAPLNQAERLELLTGLFRIGAFQTGQFTLKSGKVSPFYIDLRRIGADPRLMQLTGRAYASLLDDIEAVHIAGIPVAALPLAAAAALNAGMSLIYPRLEKKSHGSGAAVEGLWKKGDHVVMLDDLITTGGSKREAAAVLRQAGLITQNLIVLIERGTEGRRDMEKAGIRLKSWARIEDLIDAGAQTGLIDPQTASQVRDYARAPALTPSHAESPLNSSEINPKAPKLSKIN